MSGTARVFEWQPRSYGVRRFIVNGRKSINNANNEAFRSAESSAPLSIELTRTLKRRNAPTITSPTA